MTHYLSLYDTTGIQSYIFGGNRLKENLGTSQLVYEALETWLAKIVETQDGSLHWVGGGNSLVASSEERYKKIARALSEKLLLEAPGLQVACVHELWDGQDSSWYSTLHSLQKKLMRQKQNQRPEPLFDGGGVTKRCASTADPASCIETDSGEALSASVQTRRSAVERARNRLKRMIDLPNRDHWIFTDEVDKLGSSRGEHSFIGVIHFDGNGMGERFQACTSQASYKGLADAVKGAGKATLQESFRWLESRLDRLDGAPGGISIMEDENESSSQIFRVRPIVFGGDDITLICDGRIALDLAAKLLEVWHDTASELPEGGAAHACEGVALVKMRYPFFRAYQLAEDLCKHAKKYLRHNNIYSIESLDAGQRFAGLVLCPSEVQATFGVCIDKNKGIAEDQKRYDMEWVVAGTRFGMNLELEVIETHRHIVLVGLLNILDGLEQGLVPIGRRTRRGFGACRIGIKAGGSRYRLEKFDYCSRESPVSWLLDDWKAERSSEQVACFLPKWESLVGSKSEQAKSFSNLEPEAHNAREVADVGALAGALGIDKWTSRQHGCADMTCFELSLELAGSILVRSAPERADDVDARTNSIRLWKKVRSTTDPFCPEPPLPECSGIIVCASAKASPVGVNGPWPTSW